MPFIWANLLVFHMRMWTVLKSKLEVWDIVMPLDMEFMVNE